MVRSSTAAVAALLVMLAACGDADGARGTGGETGQTHSSGVPIVSGEYPFNLDERCYGGTLGSGDRQPTYEVGCDQREGGVAPLAGAGTVFHSDDNLAITYRGGAVTRQDGPDSANPEALFATVVLDVTLPAGRSYEVNHGGFEDLRVAAHAESTHGDDVLSSCGAAPVDDSQDGRWGASFISVDRAETFTVLYCFVRSGPPSFVDGEPYITVRSLLDTGDGQNRAHLAVLDQGMDTEALGDVRDSIQRISDLTDASEAEAGLAWFDQRFGAAADAGESLRSSDKRTAGAGQPGGSDGSEPDEHTTDTLRDGPADTVTPPPNPFEEDELRDQGYSDGYRDGADEAATGETRYKASYDDPDSSHPGYSYGYEQGFEDGVADEVE